MAEENDQYALPEGYLPIRKDRLAIALKYRQGEDDAPRVKATGKGYIAEQIIAIARENGVEVLEDAELAKILSVLELDAVIPLEAYVAVAEILSYVYKANQKAGNQS